MKKLLAVAILILLITCTVISQPGCNSGSEVIPSESNHWLELLSVLPANENTLKRAYVQDGAYLAEKIEQYPQGTDKYAIAHSHHLSGLGQYYDEEEWQQTLGFTKEDVDKTVLAGTEVHFTNYQAVHVIVDRDTVINAVKTGPLNNILEIADYHGVEYYSWGEDNEIDLSRMSLVRPLGIGYRLAYIDGFIFWTAWTDGIKEMIDSYEGNITSLADNEDYKLLAGALEELDTVTAFFSTESQSKSDIIAWWQNRIGDDLDYFSEQNQRFLGAVDDTFLLEPYLAFATGAGIDERGYYMAIVLLNPDETTAQSNAAILEKRIEETQSIWQGYHWLERIESMDIKSQGRLTLAKLYGGIVESWHCPDMYDEDGPYEPFLLHE